MPPNVKALEAKTLLYWKMQMHWNGRSQDLIKFNPFEKIPTMQDGIQAMNGIMTNLDPARLLSQLAFKLQGEMVCKPDRVAASSTSKLPKVKSPDELVGMQLSVQVGKDGSANISA